MNSTLFLSQLSCVDHAFISPEGKIVGGSWLPDVFVTGKVIGDESVVVDFSTIKKDIKSLIDDQDNGFDHKLLFFRNQSNGIIESSDGQIVISTPHVIFTGPRNSVKIIEENTPQLAMKLYLEEGLKIKYPDLEISIDVNIKMDRVHGIGDNQFFFRYVHGLKSSTSWGCGNLAHGHLSFLEPIGGDPLSNRLILNQLAAALDQMMFVYKENIIDKNDDQITIGYDETVCGRGPFKITFNAKSNKHLIMDTETTIEYLAEFVRVNWGSVLRSHGIKALLISEGLSKGAVIELTSEQE